MPTDEVARDVARKLRYYMQVERLEEGFDLSGPEIPRRHYETRRRPPVYSGSTLHDKSLKVYFHNDSIRHFLRDLSPDAASSKQSKSTKRRKDHVNNLEHHMAQAEFREPFDRVPSGQRSQSQAYKLNVKRPRPQSAFPSGLSTLRRTAPVSVSPLEAHRMVNTAAKLLVATETVAFHSGALQRSTSNQRRMQEQQNVRLPEVSKPKRRRSKRLKGKKQQQPRSSLTVEESVGEDGMRIKEDASDYVKPIRVEDIEIQAIHEESVKIQQPYKLMVYTGSKRGLASDVSVKLKLHGEEMDTGWIKLTDSQSNDIKFQTNQKDIFSMETGELGPLTAVSIGHNKAAPGCNWYLNRVEVEDIRAGKVYVFTYSDFVPHSKTTAIGMRRIELTSVRNSGEPGDATARSFATNDGPTSRSNEDRTSQLSASTISSSTSTPRKDAVKKKKKTKSHMVIATPAPVIEESKRSRSKSSTSGSSSRSSSGSSSSSEKSKSESKQSSQPPPPQEDSASSSSTESEDEKTATEEKPDDDAVLTANLVVETVEDEDLFDKEAPPKETIPPPEGEKEEEKPAVIPAAVVVPIPEQDVEPDVVDDVPREPEEITRQLEDTTVAEVHQVVELEPQQVDKCIAEENQVLEEEEQEQEKTDDKAPEPEVVPEPEPDVPEPELEVKPVEPPEPEREPTPEPEPEKEPEAEVEQEGTEQVAKEVVAEAEEKVDTHRSSMSSEDGFLEELNLIKNSRFTEQDRQPENWMQFGGCTLKCIETTVPFSDNRFACLVHNRSARFAGVAQNILGKLVDGARYKLTAQVRLADTVEDHSTQDKISCTLHYKLEGEGRFQQLKLTEVGLVKVTQWSYLIGWLDLSPIQKNGVAFAAIRLCFDGPEGKNDFLVSNVLLTQEYAEDEARKINIVSNGAFDQFVLTPQNWKGVGQASIVLSDELYHGSKQGCMTVERPFAYSGIAQSILDIVEPGRHYSFTTYVRIVESDAEKAKEQHSVKWVLKYNTGESKGDIAYEIAKSDKVDSTKWTKMNGELNMTELKTSTGRPVLSALSHKSNVDGNRAKDQFGQPLEYCTFHLETTAGVNLCIAGPRMIDGGKILKPAGDQTPVKPVVAVVSPDDDDDQPKDSASEASSARSSSSSSSEDEDEEEKKDSEKESPTEEKEKAALDEKEQEPDTLSVKQREQEQQLKNLHHAIEIGDREEVIRILKNDQYLVNMPETAMEFTAAHQAAIHKRAELIRPLYDYAADFNCMSRAGFMPIHYASWNNDVECLEQLRLFGASLNELTAERHTPLHIAAMRGNKEAVKWLMINGCVLNYRDNYDRTPADVASLNDHDAISILIAKCVNKLKQNQDIDGIITETDLSAAVTPMSSLTANGPEILDSLPEQVHTNAGDVDQLHEAIATNDESAVKEILVQKPHIVNLPSRRGETAIHVATINGYPNIIKLLSSMGSELSQQTPTGYQPIHLATLHNHTPCLDVLNSLDVDIDAKTPDQQTPLHLAAERGLLDSVKWLIEQGAVLNFRNSQRKNPSDLAIEKGHPNIAELIKACVAKLKRGEDVADILKNY